MTLNVFDSSRFFYYSMVPFPVQMFSLFALQCYWLLLLLLMMSLIGFNSMEWSYLYTSSFYKTLLKYLSAEKLLS